MVLNSYEVQTLLDRSCAVAINTWANSLAFQGHNWSKGAACSAYQNLRSSLSNYTMPSYDDIYVAAAYIVRYQLSHIYMSKTALEFLNQSARLHHKDIRIIDFGSGASACRIATTLMVAESLERGQDIDHVDILEVDTSGSMQSIGEILWQAFVEIVLIELANSPLAQAVRITSCSQVSHWTSALPSGFNTWLTAFHAIYPYSYDMRTEIARIFNHVNPTMGVFTCHTGNLPHMRWTFPFWYRREWSNGRYGSFTLSVPSRCPTKFVAKQADRLGFGKEEELRPYLRASGPAVLWGSQRPLLL